LSIYLICVEYIHDRVQRQIKVSGLTSENLIDIIEEEKSK
jgi:putative membrane protein